MVCSWSLKESIKSLRDTWVLNMREMRLHWVVPTSGDPVPWTPQALGETVVHRAPPNLLSKRLNCSALPAESFPVRGYEEEVRGRITVPGLITVAALASTAGSGPVMTDREGLRVVTATINEILTAFQQGLRDIQLGGVNWDKLPLRVDSLSTHVDHLGEAQKEQARTMTGVLNAAISPTGKMDVLEERHAWQTNRNATPQLQQQGQETKGA
ncbi:hypothetical protein BDZ91DRAFT_766052 [Kalaharituber pfeilii]|nr:hypothetical protein BDZ91DRAFT_766052 [Kalaharituber pfeilii]